MMGEMLSYGFCLILTWSCLFGRNMNLSEYDIPDEVYEICLYADICHRKATLQPPEGYTSCCHSCSCEEDCGLTMNCCFDHLDKYRRVEKGEVSCIKSTIGSKVQPKHYYMISSCKMTNKVLQKAKTNACQLHDKNGTYLLAPVSSANGVYVNAMCAECNGDLNYTTWDYMHYAIMFPSSSPIPWIFEENVIGDSGTIEYIPPSSDTLSIPRACYQTNASPYCSDDQALYFPITCKNLQSTYVGTSSQSNAMYKNAACVLCNSSLYDYIFLPPCVKSNTLSSFGSFTVLIDSEILSALNLKKVFQSDTYVSSETCKSGSIKSLLTGRCLLVYCPEGLIRTKSGCKYLFKRWYANAIIMQLKLSADDGVLLPVSTIQSLSSQYLSNPNIWMKSPCPGMKMVAIYSEHGNATGVNSFVVVICKVLNHGRGFSPSHMYPVLRSCLERPWTVSIKKVAYTFTAKLDRYYGYIQDGSQTLQLVLDPFNVIDPRPLYDKIIDERHVVLTNYRTGAIARKTFFCDQVRLPVEELELGYGEIRILANNKTLGTNEFAIGQVFPIDENNVLFYVCLDDYIPQSGAPISSFVRYWLVTGNLVLFTEFCIQYSDGSKL